MSDISKLIHNDDKLSSKEDNMLLSGSSLELPNKAEELQFHFDDEEELKKREIQNYLYNTYKIIPISYFIYTKPIKEDDFILHNFYVYKENKDIKYIK